MARKKAVLARRQELERNREQALAQLQRKTWTPDPTVHPFERFQIIHENCKCNLQTLETIEKIMVRLGFSYMDCPFPGDSDPHNVYFPTGLTSSDEEIRKVAVQQYSDFVQELRNAGLEKNAYTAFQERRER